MTADAAPPAPVAANPLAYGDFRLYWLARFTVSLAPLAMVVIIGWQLYDTARSDYGMAPGEAAFQLGLFGLAQFLPIAILTPVAGWAADRFERRTVARLAMSVDFVIALTLAWLTEQDALTLPILFALGALHGGARVFLNPSMSAIAPNIVPPAVLPRAIAMSSLAWQTASIVGPAAAGLLYTARASLPYLVAAGLLVLAFVALSFIRPVHPPRLGTHNHPIRQMAEGIRYTLRERFLLGSVTLDLFAVLLGGATALMPVFARDILMVGAEGLGYLRAATGLGAVSVSLILSVRPLRHNVGVKMLWGVALFGLATMLFGLSRDLPVWLFGPGVLTAKLMLPLPFVGDTGITLPMLFALAMLAVVGGADTLSVFVRNALVQLNTPDDMRGRVGAVSGLAISASNELGEMQSGLAAAALGPVGAVVFGGIGAILVTAIWAKLFPELRNARTFEPQAREART